MTPPTCPPADHLVAYAAGELDPSQRGALERHLIDCHACSTAVAEAVAGATRRLLEVPTTPRGGLRERPQDRGAMVGRYVLLEPLGRGGMGQVYAAFDPHLERRVALKLLRDEAGDEASRRRLIREARALARLSHPHVVSVFEVGEADGQVYIAMELLRGQTLRRWLQAESRPWRAIRDTFVQAGRALAAAHAAGLVHRDFKPTNVIVDETGCARVLDFGLARAGTTSARDAPTPTDVSGFAADDVTGAGSIAGTPPYMAPEQLRGSFDAKSDQFSFGVSLYSALSDAAPFVGATFVAREEAIRAGPAELPGDLPRWLRLAVMRMLAFEPSDRFESMDVAVDALQVDLRQRRRRLRGAVLTGVLSATFASGVTLAFQPGPTPSEVTVIDGVESQARAAADEGHYVYPPHDRPEAPTAYEHVAELERIRGASAPLAHARAQALRTEFADALEESADELWDAPGGRGFARDLYAAATTFDPERVHARERCGLTPGELEQLRADAATGSFAEMELAAAAPLAHLASLEKASSKERLAELARSSSPTRAARLGAAAEIPSSDVVEPASPAAGPIGTGQPQPPATAEPSVPTPRAGASSEPGSMSSRADVDEDIDLGWREYRALRWAAAARHFSRALGSSPPDPRALHGLAAALFEQGHYHRGIGYAKQAVDARPRDTKLRVLLGDLYFRTHEYDEARRQYERARDRGDAAGAAGLRRLEKALGG